MSSQPSIYSTTNNSTATLRPRATRLISYVDEQDSSVSTSGPASPVASTSTFTRPSQTASHLASSKGTAPVDDYEGRGYLKRHSRAASENVIRRPSAGLWESWSSISGIASSLLGSDGSHTTMRRSDSTKKGTKTMQQDKTYTVKPQREEWGPKTEVKTKATTSIEEQRALLQARRRELLLLQSTEAQRDSLGRFKRKDSDASVRSYQEGHHEDDVLIYRHTVLPHDTMAGVVIKYSCHPEDFRKANRFWPNDNIQRRTHVVLPVESCGIRGRKLDDVLATELLQGDFDTKLNLHGTPEAFAKQPAASSPINSPPKEPSVNEEDYKHDSWVLLPSSTQPVQVLRLSRRKLGYFPPARRKSNASAFVDSPNSTPRTSLDTLRHAPSHAAQQAQLQRQATTSPGASPGRASLISIPGRERSSSTLTPVSTSSANSFLTALHGPGGVGTLRGLRTELARPGPAEDPLNKKFAQYIPDLLHPGTDPSILHPMNNKAGNSSLRATPRASMDSIRSTRSNSSTTQRPAGGWIRKIAGSATTSGGLSPMRKRTGVNRTDSSDLVGQLADGDISDLIELDATPDEVSKQLHEQADTTPRPTPMLVMPDNGHRNDEALLNERFPVRGRVRRAYERD